MPGCPNKTYNLNEVVRLINDDNHGPTFSRDFYPLKGPLTSQGTSTFSKDFYLLKGPRFLFLSKQIEKEKSVFVKIQVTLALI